MVRNTFGKALPNLSGDSRRHAPLGLRKMTRAQPECCAIPKKARNRGAEFRGMPDRRQSLSRVELPGYGRKVFHVRSHDYRLPEECRFQNIVAAAHCQRAAHE